MQLSARKTRLSINFDYEFQDGTKEELTYFAPTTKMIDKSMKIDAMDYKSQLEDAKTILKNCIEGNRIEDFINELESSGNIYQAKKDLDAELGKLRQQR